MTIKLIEKYQGSALEGEKITAKDVDISSRLQSIKIIELIREKIAEIKKNNIVVTKDQLLEMFRAEIKQKLGNDVDEIGMLAQHTDRVFDIIHSYLHRKEYFEFFVFNSSFIAQEKKEAESILSDMRSCVAENGETETIKKLFTEWLFRRMQIYWRDEVLSSEISDFDLPNNISYYTSEFFKNLMSQFDREFGSDYKKAMDILHNDPSFLTSVFSEISVNMENILSEAHKAVMSTYLNMKVDFRTPMLDFLSLEPINQWGALSDRLTEYRKKWLIPLADTAVPWNLMTLDQLAVLTQNFQEKLANISTETEEKIAQWKKIASEWWRP